MIPRQKRAILNAYQNQREKLKKAGTYHRRRAYRNGEGVPTFTCSGPRKYPDINSEVVPDDAELLRKHGAFYFGL